MQCGALGRRLGAVSVATCVVIAALLTGCSSNSSSKPAGTLSAVASAAGSVVSSGQNLVTAVSNTC